MPPRIVYFLAILLALGIGMRPTILRAQPQQIRVDLTALDNSGHMVSGSFGLDGTATYCIDGYLGEFELPVGGCVAPGLCLAFKDVRTGDGACLGEGITVDFRPYSSPAQVDTYRVAFAFQNYPVVIYWSRNLLQYYDGVKLKDEAGGTLLSVDMLGIDSIMLSSPAIQSFTIMTSGPKGLTDIAGNQFAAPRNFRLFGNYPNPFNPSTNISFDLPGRSSVHLAVFDLLGREVALLMNDEMAAGHHSIEWDASRQPSGVYYYRLNAGNFSDMNKMVLLR